MNKGKDGYYRSSFRHDGKTYTVIGKTEAEVYRKIGKRKAELEAGAVKVRAMTVRQYAREWAQTYHGTDSETDKDYRRIVEKHIIPALGDRKMTEVTEAMLQRLLNNLKLSPSRIHKVRITLGQMFHKAQKNHVISDDPAEDLTVPEVKKTARRAITEEERELLLTVLPHHRGNIYCKLMLYCGLRPGEVNALQWKHVDLAVGVVKVRQAMKHNSTVIGSPKSAAGIRDIPIPDILGEELHGGTPEDYVASWTGGAITRAAQHRMWLSVLREMDILAGATVYRNQIIESKIADDLDLYCLRHAYCTDLQRAGVPINIAKTLMGHSSIEVTARIYTHTGLEDARRAVMYYNLYYNSKVRAETAWEHKGIAESFPDSDSVFGGSNPSSPAK